MASIVIGPLATFDRPLRDEELPTLIALAAADWSVDMDLSPNRGEVELSSAPRLPQRPSRPTAPSLAFRRGRLSGCRRG